MITVNMTDKLAAELEDFGSPAQILALVNEFGEFSRTAAPKEVSNKREENRERNQKIYDYAQQLLAGGNITMRQVAAKVNEAGFRTPRNGDTFESGTLRAFMQNHEKSLKRASEVADAPAAPENTETV